MEIADLKRTGVEKFRNTGLDVRPTHLYNPDWKGEGVLSPFAHMTRYKWRWPTLTGRRQFYLDHYWGVLCFYASSRHLVEDLVGRGR